MPRGDMSWCAPRQLSAEMISISALDLADDAAQ